MASAPESPTGRSSGYEPQQLRFADGTEYWSFCSSCRDDGGYPERKPVYWDKDGNILWSRCDCMGLWPDGSEVLRLYTSIEEVKQVCKPMKWGTQILLCCNKSDPQSPCTPQVDARGREVGTVIDPFPRVDHRPNCCGNYRDRVCWHLPCNDCTSKVIDDPAWNEEYPTDPPNDTVPVVGRPGTRNASQWWG